MYILALETSTQLGSVCLFENDNLLLEKTSTNQKSHSDFINKSIESVLSEASVKLEQIDLFASGLGPGSFTGIRIAINVAKTFSYMLKKPIVAVDSLRLLAHQVSATQKQTAASIDKPILTLINAYKNMNYTAVFSFQNGQLVQLRQAEAVPVKNLDEWLAADEKTRGLSDFYVVGDGFSTYEKHFPTALLPKMSRPPQTLDYPEGKTLGKLAFTMSQSGQTMDWKSLTPLYIRASEAEENKRGLIFLPLK